MTRPPALLLSVVAVLCAQTPAPEDFRPAKLVKFYGETPPYYYTFDTGRGGFVAGSDVLLRVIVGSHVKIRLRFGTVYLIDEDGKIQEARFIMNYDSAPPIPKQ